MPKLQLPLLAWHDGTRPPSQAVQLSDLFALIQDYLSFVPRADFVEATSPGTVDVPFRVSHSLNEEPRFVSAITESGTAIVYADANDKLEWTETYVKIRCSVANLRMIVKVER